MTVGFVILMVPFLNRVSQRVMSDTSKAITEISMLIISIIGLDAPVQEIGMVRCGPLHTIRAKLGVTKYGTTLLQRFSDSI